VSRRGRASALALALVIALVPAGGAVAQTGAGEDPSPASQAGASARGDAAASGEAAAHDEALAEAGSSVLDGPPPDSGPEPLWVPDPADVSESDDAPAEDARETATVAAGIGTDDASRVAIAHWMASAARDAGLPGELPVMAALVESGLNNIPYGDADSVGFFQMRLSVWDHGEYAGYLARPELQLQWFVDHALALRDARRAGGDATFGEDPAGWGEWIADVEQPYAPYRGRYQLQLDAARALLALPAGTISPLALGLTVGGPAAPAPDPAGDPLAKRVLRDDRITVESRSRSDLETPGRIDPRLSAVLLEAAKLFAISLWVLQTGHSYYTAGGSVSNHSAGRAADIGSVAGEVVTPSNKKAKELALALGRLPAPLRPTEIGSPWELDGPEYFTDGDHQDHLHVGFDDPAVAGDEAIAARLEALGAAAVEGTPAAPRAEPRFEAGDAPANGEPESGAEPRFDVGG
jgi:hypothetical protein